MKYARTSEEFDAEAIEAHVRHAMHWDLCPSKNGPDGCKRCDDLDFLAFAAEERARVAHREAIDASRLATVGAA